MPTDTPHAPSSPRVVIVGCGFGGMDAAKALRRTNDAQITIIDKRNHHLFQPLLYQVATAALSPADIASPIRRIFRNQPNVTVLLDEVTAIDPERKIISLDDSQLEYDYLVLAAGATHSYFGHDEWESVAPGLKTIEDATEIRRRILMAFEQAEHEPDPAKRTAALTFVIVGAGPTGVELAGAIKEIAVQTIPRDFRTIDTRTARVILIEGGDRLLSSFDPSLSARAQRDLEKLGIEIITNTYVTDLKPGLVTMGQRTIEAGNVFWAAGVKANPLATSLGCELDPTGRVLVEPDLSVPGHPEIFVVGDMAAARLLDKDSNQSNTWVPGVAQGALQGGTHAGKIIAREIESGLQPGSRSDRPPFRYKDKGSMATIGRAKAVAEIGGFKLGGLIAWLMWGLIHVMFLVEFSNRILVMMQWTWNWFAFTRGARLITGGRDKPANPNQPSTPLPNPPASPPSP
ncbi:MAG: NAD(P)/FAD-dependent oxidoreductase [Phycisphaerales bacterium JB065]